MKKEIKILIVDDEADVLDFISYNLQRDGYKTFTAKDGIEAVQMAAKERPDLVLLDIMMPRLDGFAVAEHLRLLHETKTVLIVFLTAKNDEDSELRAFSLGADDYITKPIKPRLLQTRIKALLRRKFEWSNGTEAIQIGNIMIDHESRMVKVGEEKVFLARKEFELLSLLASRPGRVFPRDEIMTAIWNDEETVGDRTIDVHIRKIRQKVGETNIKTVKGIGYKFDA